MRENGLDYGDDEPWRGNLHKINDPNSVGPMRFARMMDERKYWRSGVYDSVNVLHGTWAQGNPLDRRGRPLVSLVKDNQDSEEQADGERSQQVVHVLPLPTLETEAAKEPEEGELIENDVNENDEVFEKEDEAEEASRKVVVLAPGERTVVEGGENQEKRHNDCLLVCPRQKNRVFK